jgi:hypothetical protein
MKFVLFFLITTPLILIKYWNQSSIRMDL